MEGQPVWLPALTPQGPRESGSSHQEGAAEGAAEWATMARGLRDSAHGEVTQQCCLTPQTPQAEGLARSTAQGRPAGGSQLAPGEQGCPGTAGTLHTRRAPAGRPQALSMTLKNSAQNSASIKYYVMSNTSIGDGGSSVAAPAWHAQGPGHSPTPGQKVLSEPEEERTFPFYTPSTRVCERSV